MNYEVSIDDPNKYISTIYILKNTRDILLVNVEFIPKYLQLFQVASSDGYYGFDFMPDADTLYIDETKRYLGSGHVKFKIEDIKYPYLNLDIGKSNCVMVYLRFPNYKKSKRIYEKEGFYNDEID